MSRCHGAGNAAGSVRAETEGSGFILVGVVMFMLALTILGLSLFALSSYEGQFFYATQSREQSLQNAESGIRIVQALIEQSGKLTDAQQALGQYGITSVIAYQSKSSNANDTTSAGNVDWDSTLVIQVTARSGSVERTIQARYVPVPGKSPYRQLFSCGGTFMISNANGNSGQQYAFNGPIWQHVQAPADTAWTQYAQWSSGRPIDPSPPAAIAGDPFVGAKLTGAIDFDNQQVQGNALTLRMNNTSGGVQYYKSPSAYETNGYDFEYGNNVNLAVRGISVWLVDAGGARFGNTLTVSPDNGPSTLVIVAKRNGTTNRGLWFQGGIAISDTSLVHVYLVTDGDLAIDQLHANNSDDFSYDARALSVVAGGNLELTGPESGHISLLGHAVAMDSEVNNLTALQALPWTSAGLGHAFAFAPHSWKETGPP